MRNESSAFRLCSLLKHLWGLESALILNYGDHFPSAEGCLLNSIQSRALIRNIWVRAWIQGNGAGGVRDAGEGPRRSSGGYCCSTSSPSDLPRSLGCQLPALLFPFSVPVLSHHLSTPTLKLQYRGWWDKAFHFLSACFLRQAAATHGISQAQSIIKCDF